MSSKILPTRRVYDVMDQAGQSIVYWLGLLLVVCAIEYSKGSFSVDPFQTYTFVILQAPLHALVIYASMCMMHIGYHLAILGKSPQQQFVSIDQLCAKANGSFYTIHFRFHLVF